MNLTETMARYGALVDDALKSRMDAAGKPGDALVDAMRYSLFAGGKRIRPVLCLAAAQLCGGDCFAALPAACALEMIHTYSLIHDDLPAMDNDDFRRGKPSNHRVFGEANAILAGDGLLSLAFVELAGLGCPGALSAIARGAFDMVAGQSLDMNPTDGETQLLRIHALKTGALITAAVLAGAFVAGASERDRAALVEFSEAYGLLFQITDDILDASGDAALLGKTTGKDAAEGKTTFVTCYGLDEAVSRARTAAEAAKTALLPFGERAAFFLELTEHTLTRVR